MSNPIPDELDEIRQNIHQGMYDHMSEKGCTQVTNEVMEQIQALITEARIEAREDSYSECFRIIKEVNDKLFMYEILMGKIDYDYNGTDTVEKFKQYQELEPERVKFGAWLEAQEKQLKENK